MILQLGLVAVLLVALYHVAGWAAVAVACGFLLLLLMV